MCKFFRTFWCWTLLFWITLILFIFLFTWMLFKVLCVNVTDISGSYNNIFHYYVTAYKLNSFNFGILIYIVIMIKYRPIMLHHKSWLWNICIEITAGFIFSARNTQFITSICEFLNMLKSVSSICVHEGVLC